MKHFEDELRSALRRVEPPEGFARRVMERLDFDSDRRTVPPRGQRIWWTRWAAAAAVVILATGLVLYRRRRAGEAARAETLMALRIASRQFNGVLKRVVELPPPRRRDRTGGRS
jgi:hypothetical protein